LIESPVCIMKAAIFASVVSTVAADSLSLSFKDCGAKHAVTKDVQPTTLELGADTAITGTGSLDKAVSGGTYDMELKAGGGLIDSHFTGKNCEAKDFTLPLGLGTLSWDGIACPLAAADSVSIGFHTKLASSLPAALATSDIHLGANDQDGESVLCVDLHLAKQETLEEIAERVNSGSHGWKAAAPTKFASVEDVKPFLGAFLPGDERYEEPEVVEIPATNGDLPDSFDSAENWPSCSVIANVRDQSSCGSCWAFGSVASFESRACIANGKDVKYSPEDTAFCSNAGFGCQGGNSAWGYFKSTGVVTGGDYTDIGSGDSCYPYSLAPCAHHVPATAKYPACPSSEYPSPSCKRSCSESGYSQSFSADKLRATKTMSVRGEQQIMQELVTNGPMYVAFSVYSDFPTYKSGVYTKTAGSSYLGGHAVTLVGYGTEDGKKYWKIKNSWNEQWGNGGHFLIARGQDECGIESSVSAGMVSASTVV
jgi:cathepsin B